MRKVYEGSNVDGNWSVSVNGKTLNPIRSQQLYNHSPDGFSWGYGGSGPSQLALGILLDFFNNAIKAEKYYQDFKWTTVAKWPQSGSWRITGEEIEKIVTDIKHERRARQTTAHY